MWLCTIFSSIVSFFSYSGDLTQILWPRFRRILQLNIASVRDTNPSRLGNIDTRPHYVRPHPPFLSLSLSLSNLPFTSFPIPDYSSLCWVFSCSSEHQSESPRRSGRPLPLVSARWSRELHLPLVSARWSRELHFENGCRVPSEKRAACLSHKQLWHDAISSYCKQLLVLWIEVAS